MANLRFCDKLIANRGKFAIRVSSSTIAIYYSQSHWECVIGVVSGFYFLVKLSLEMEREDCARNWTQLAATRPDFIL